MDISQKISHVEFLNREYNKTHLAYEKELAFFNSIKTGNLTEMKKLFKPLDCEQLGKLSNDFLRNMKYHLIITVALVTRFCIEGGMEMESAFNLSDIYIQSIDKCKNADEVNMLHIELVNDYTQRMQFIYKKTLYPKPIIVCLDYIYDNLHKKISLNKLAEVANLSPSHLSRMFHKETGTTISAYIMKKRIETAENMLKYSEYSCIDISEYLCFSSESHFIQIFKKKTGYTPKAYREAFFRQRSNNI